MAPAGFAVTPFAANLHTPQPHDKDSGIIGWITKQFQKRAVAGAPSPDRIVLLRVADGDGVAETQSVFIERLHSPFGMALIGNKLYVVDTDALMRFDYVTGETHIASPGVKVADLPGGPINHHWTKNILASRDGERLYITVG